MQQTATARSSDWTRARDIVMAEAGLQQRLARIPDPDAFATALAAELSAFGIELAQEEIASRLPLDPADTERFLTRPPSGTAWPSSSWLPMHAGASAEGAFIDWMYFGDKPLTEPFFFDSVRQMQSLPFNRAFRYRLTLQDFVSGAEDAPAPDGFIFHMSRCGSTLVAQMIARLPGSIVVSEPPPLEQILQLCRGADEDVAIKPLRAMVAAFGRRRRGKAPHVLKLDCWHILALPLFRRAFPDVPWVFLYRDPVEVLVSQTRDRGMQMVPQFVPPSLFGLETDIPDEDYCARVLAAICRGAVEHAGLGGGLVINYRQLPEAVEGVILPHFGIRIDESERAAMRQAARRDAKQPYQEFTSDSADKQREAGTHLRTLAKRHLAELYESLEDLRQRQS